MSNFPICYKHKGLYINISKILNMNIKVYINANWAEDIVNHKLINGYAIFVDEVPVI